MSYFNDDQRDHMRELARIRLADKCWCCWYRLGECPHCPPDKTGADKMAARCPDARCKGEPSPDGSRPIVHTIYCTTTPVAARAGEE